MHEIAGDIVQGGRQACLKARQGQAVQSCAAVIAGCLHSPSLVDGLFPPASLDRPWSSWLGAVVGRTILSQVCRMIGSSIGRIPELSGDLCAWKPSSAENERHFEGKTWQNVRLPV